MCSGRLLRRGEGDRKSAMANMDNGGAECIGRVRSGRGREEGGEREVYGLL